MYAKTQLLLLMHLCHTCVECAFLLLNHGTKIMELKIEGISNDHFISKRANLNQHLCMSIL